jgi:hypothetical protein
MGYTPPGHRPARRNPPDRRARRTLQRQRAVTHTRTQCLRTQCLRMKFLDTVPGHRPPGHRPPGHRPPGRQPRLPWKVARKRRKIGRGHPRHTDQCRGNAVGSHSVKVGAAPDTPSWGQVLARHLLRDRLDRRAVSVTLRQLSGSLPPLRIHESRNGCGDPGAGGRSRRATPAVWARSETPAPAVESGLVLWPPAGIGSGHVAQADARNATAKARQIRQYLVRLISPGRDTGSNGRRRGRRPLPGKDPS